MIVGVTAFREHFAEYTSRIAAGETIIVLRRGIPWAMVRQVAPGDEGRLQSVEAFRLSLAEGLHRARQAPVVLIWHNKPIALVTRADKKQVVEVVSQ